MGLPGGGGEYFLLVGYWGMCHWMGSHFKTGLTIMGLHFQQSSRQSYYNGVTNCRDFGGKKILASGI